MFQRLPDTVLLEWLKEDAPYGDLTTQTLSLDKLPGHIFNIGFTFEALLVCADAHKRAGSTNGQALADAMRTTKIEKRAMVGGPIEFDAKGQCNTIASVVLQNRGGVPTVVLPEAASVGKPIFPMPGWNDKRRT